MDTAIANQLTTGGGIIANSATDTTRRFLNTAIQFFGALTGATQDSGADEWLGVKLRAAQAVAITANTTLTIGSINFIDTTIAAITALNLPDDGDGIDSADLEDGELVIIIDISGKVETNPCTVNGNSNNVKLQDQTAASTDDLNTNFGMTINVWDNSAGQRLANALT